MSLNQVYHYDGVTKTAITASVIKLSATQGVYPDFGGMTVELSYPVLDANGSEVTLEKGDLLWCNVNWATTRWFAPGLGEISDIKRSGDFVTVKVDSMLEPLMRMRYVIDNTVSGFVSNRIWDVITKHTPPHGITVSSHFLLYRRETGPATWNLDTTMDKVVHGLEVDVRAYFQYLIEQPINLWLEKPTGTIFPVYGYVDHWDLPTFAVGYSGYGNHRQADLILSRDNGILSEIEWEEPTASVLNDVTITVRGGGSGQFTDAASIAAYGKRQTTLSRGIYLADAVDGYDATRSIKSIVKSMAVPHKRCRLTCEATAIFNSWQTVGGMYRVIDDATGQDEYMALRSFTYRYPEEVAECEFDNAPLDMSKYGLRMENRVTSLEANQVTAHAGFFDLQGGVSPSEYYHLSQTAYNNLYQQDQGVKTTDSPSFALLNISSPSGTAMFGPANTSFCHIYTDRPAFVFDKSISCNPSSGLDLGLSNRYWRHLYMNGNLMMNGSVLADASKNIAASNVTLGSDTDTDLNMLAIKRLGTTGDGTLVSEWRMWTDANRGYLRFYRGGVSKCELFADRGGYWYSSVPFTVNGALTASAMTISDTTSGILQVPYIRFNKGAEVRICNTGGTINFVSNWAGDAWQSIKCGSVRTTGYLIFQGTYGNVLCPSSGYIQVRNSTDSGYGYIRASAYYVMGTQIIDSSGFVTTGRINLNGSAPLFYWSETDNTLPAGRWRMGVDGDALLIDHNTAADGLYGTRERSYFNSDGFFSHQDVHANGAVSGMVMATRTMTASSTVQNLNAAGKSTTSLSLVVLKKTKVNYAMTGTYYIKWSLRSTTYGTTVYGRLYKNGVALGALRSTNSDGGVEYTEGPYTNIAAGDEFQIYAYTTSGNVAVSVYNLKICFTPSTILPLYSQNA